VPDPMPAALSTEMEMEEAVWISNSSKRKRI
jgi:hypothetical protein